MSANIDALQDILTEELKAYEKIEGLEIDKTDAIVNRDGELLERLVKEQEAVLADVDRLELKRRDAASLFRTTSLDVPSLNVIAAALGGDSGEALRFLGAKLRSTLENLKKITRINEACLQDNMDFFAIVLEGLRGEVSYDKGYSDSGKMERTNLSGAALFNQTV